MRYLKPATAGILTLATLACAVRQTPVQVVGEPFEMSALVGEWNGEYTSGETGRSGSIVFRLKSVSDTAYGDVVMVPRSAAQPSVNPDGPSARVPVPQALSQVLSIRFVRVEADRIVGTLDPYTDPVCGCRLLTTFNGTFTGGSKIEGVFETRGSDMSHPVTHGVWKVTRLNTSRGSK